METTTIHPAEAYLRNADTPPSLYVRIDGERRRLFTNRDDSIIGIVAPGKRKRSYIFTSWSIRSVSNTESKIQRVYIERDAYAVVWSCVAR